MQNKLDTSRLYFTDLDTTDPDFIQRLVNTQGWLKFIGERNVKTKEDALAYIQRLIDNPAINYQVVNLKDQKLPIGVISLIKRDYLDHHDIGFAFLPEYEGKGYAYEAAKSLLDVLINDPAHTRIMASTVTSNTRSIQLLEKLGLKFQHEMEINNEKLFLYAIETTKSVLDNLTTQFFGIFTNKEQNLPDWEMIHKLCLPQTLIIKKTEFKEEIYNLDTFIEPRKIILSDGTLQSFEEWETAEETKITGHIAQRFSTYSKSGLHNGKSFQSDGHKLFQFVNTQAGWKINAVIWEDE